MATLASIERLRRLIDKNTAYRNPTLDYSRVVNALEQLGNAVNGYEGETEDWIYLGECETPIDSMIVGGYWHLSEWHSGQWSDTYRALCSLAQVFSPGMSDGPEEESSEHDFYSMLESLAEEAR